MNALQTKAFSTFLEIKRNQKHLTQEAFVSGIVSVRQYRRYLRGLSLISDHFIAHISNRLECSSDELMKEYERVRIDQKKMIHDLYNKIVNYDYKTASQIKKQLHPKMIIDSDALLIYRYALLIEAYQLKKIDDKEMEWHVKRLIHYPEILDQTALDSSEVLVVSSLLSHPGFDDHQKLSDRLMIYARQNDVLYSSQIDKNYVIVLSRLAKHQGIRKDLQGVTELCNMGISYSLDRMSLYMLDYFYYFNALAYHGLGDTKRYEEMLFKCFAAMHVVNNPAKYKKFKALIDKDFNIDWETMMIDYIKLRKHESLSIV